MAATGGGGNQSGVSNPPYTLSLTRTPPLYLLPLPQTHTCTLPSENILVLFASLLNKKLMFDILHVQMAVGGLWPEIRYAENLVTHEQDGNIPSIIPLNV